ncbi:MAG: hypothetical protein E2O56_07205 [Gammaproteobacteria bacterium]|nr:MAG: hypothetical protein E2O56_07205 [Gammaproteobacteria bacterium]
MSLFTELQRRNVIKVAMLYVIVAWLILQVGEILVPLLILPDSVLRIVFFILVLGFPPALIFAWAFEITPEGIKRDRDVDPAQSIASDTSRRLNYLIVGLLVVAIGLLIVGLWTEEGAAPDTVAETAEQRATTGAEVKTPDTAKISVAVLPFINMSNDPDNEYFSDGISEELLNVLVKVEGLRVPSRTSSFAFKGGEKSLGEIAEILKVDHVLEGSVRKAGNTVRVTAQLIEVKTDTHLWSDTYDRELTDIFAIQDEIANSIVEALTSILGAEAIRVKVVAPTDNLEAYQLYLRGRSLWWMRYGDAVPRAIEYFKQAVGLDPGFARAWSGLAAAYQVLSTYTDAREDEVLPLSAEAANKALALDPGLAEAQAVLAQFLVYRAEWREADSAFRRAVEMDDTDVLSRVWYGLFLSSAGYTTEAMQYLRSVEELDPINALAQAHLGLLNEFQGSREEALRYADMAVRGGMQFAIMVHYDIAMQEGRYEEAYLVVEEFLAAYGNTNPCLGLLRDTLEGRVPRERAIECIDGQTRFGDGSDWYLPDYDLQITDRMIKTLEEMSGSFFPGFQWLWGPRGAFVRQSPEFRDFAERVGLVALWKERGWPDLCHPVGDSFECN